MGDSFAGLIRRLVHRLRFKCVALGDGLLALRCGLVMGDVGGTFSRRESMQIKISMYSV